VAEQSLNAGQRATVLSAYGGRAVIRPGKYLWAGFDPSVAGNSIMGDYASKVALDHIVPGTKVRKQVEKERLPLIFIPGMAASRLVDLSDYPTQDPGIIPGL